MRKIVAVSAFVALVVSAFALYAITYDTGRLSDEVGELNAKIAAREAELAVLTAEKANLTRPARIDRLVRAHLTTLRPTNPRQLGTIAELPWRGEAILKDAPPVALQP